MKVLSKRSKSQLIFFGCFKSTCKGTGFFIPLLSNSNCNCFLFVLYLLFWNHILTWVSDNFKILANSERSKLDRYRCLKKRCSSALTCEWLKAARDRFCLAFTFFESHWLFLESELEVSSENKQETLFMIELRLTILQ